VVTQSSLPLLPNFQYSSILRNDINTLYTVTNWLNINPLPCILETNAPVTIWKKPMLTRLSSIELYGNNYAVYDVVGAGPQLDDIWFFNGSVPTAYYNAGGRLGGSISKVAMWNPMPPDNNIFNIPVDCLPRSNMDGKKRSTQLAGPVFPVGFTIYIDGFVAQDSMVSEKIIYYDGSHNFVRIDYNGYNILQRGSDVYRYAGDNSQLNPFPCEYYYAPSPVWAPPVLSDNVLNVTFNGSPATVWQAFDHDVPTQYQYWYFDLIFSPLYLIDSTMVGGKVMYFESKIPPIGIFDIPTFCFTL